MQPYITFLRKFGTNSIKGGFFRVCFNLIPYTKNRLFYTELNRKFLTTDTKQTQDNIEENSLWESEISKIGLLQERIKVLENDIDNYINKIEESQEKLLRSLAENENLRQRHKKDLDSARLYSISNFAKSLLEVADNLSKALSSVNIENINENSLLNLYNGINMTSSTLNKAFEKHGIVKFESLGKQFNPKEHEAIFEIQDSSKPKGLICEELQPGYKINDRVLRPAKVGTIKN